MKTDFPSPAGSVLLVGAGPGDPDLLTVAARDAILAADLIVHDGLVDQRILALAPATSQISVAKSRSRHTMRQEAINDLLVAEAKRGKLVVRLKGGDPFIFGRGGEEAEACLAADVAVRVIPGISAAMGAAAGALIPLTHRAVSSAVTFVAGQCQGLSEQNWSGLAGKGRTLVIYMGVATAELIAEKLIAEGVSPDMPVAVLENGTRPNARALQTLLADLGAMIARKCVQSPAVIVVGEVAARGMAADALQSLALAAEAIA
ncbi:uroporphyrinogen-III C-methyltransferase [Sphingomonas sp. 28-63-12]|uniref:uroporphyrinogen-III C-methyltransferase n=1 Tax=Sphingomonas sp. 28-63-12 TaxID=1970434 RepID=UPI000BC5BDD7|nr:MAG: uroporphyrinogen-III C-methyltransferase [Sphingomonas sp. 28-63-12]